MFEVEKWNVSNIFEIQCDDNGCSPLPVYSWIKIVGTEADICRHTSQSVTLFMHALNRIVTSAALFLSLPLSLFMSLSAMLALYLVQLCAKPLDEKWITINSFQRQAGPYCWHILLLQPASEDPHLNREDSLMCSILGGEISLLFREHWCCF